MERWALGVMILILAYGHSYYLDARFGASEIGLSVFFVRKVPDRPFIETIPDRGRTDRWVWNGLLNFHHNIYETI